MFRKQSVDGIYNSSHDSLKKPLFSVPGGLFTLKNVETRESQTRNVNSSRYSNYNISLIKHFKLRRYGFIDLFDWPLSKEEIIGRVISQQRSTDKFLFEDHINDSRCFKKGSYDFAEERSKQRVKRRLFPTSRNLRRIRTSLNSTQLSDSPLPINKADLFWLHPGSESYLRDADSNYKNDLWSSRNQMLDARLKVSLKIAKVCVPTLWYL